MKKTIFCAVFLSFFVFVGFCYAQDNNDNNVSSGMTPDSSFYFLKEWKESIQTFFTFGAENKARQYLHLSEVRLAEYQKMIEQGKTDIAQKTLEKYQQQLDKATQKKEELKQKGKDVRALTEKLEQSVAQHLWVLQNNLEKVPETAKTGLENAISNAQELLRKKFGDGNCKDLCGDNICQEVVCMEVGCPCAETLDTCPKDCVTGGQATTTNEEPQLIGGDKDEHGCLIAAGYSWCEIKKKCLRVWEEKCSKECGACPQLSPVSPDFCKGGTIEAGKKDECGCQGPPKCLSAMKACTQEAKLCPDGVTSVGRSGPNCEFAACPTVSASPYEVFAKCLTSKGIKMYGASWCPHCSNQKAMFGENWKYVDYIECALADGSQNPVCAQAGITGYPTWVFQDGKKIGGSMSLEKISEYSGCKIGTGGVSN